VECTTRSRRGVAVAAAALLAMAAVGPTARAASGAEPVRVATLLPFVEDALRGAGAGVEVVATVRRSLHVPVPEGTVDLGNPHSPDFEGLALARPDLVVGDASVHARLREALGRGGAEVVLLDTSGVDETLDALLAIGERVGARPALEARVAAVRGAIAEAALAEPVSTLVLFGAPGSFYAMTERTWLGDLLARLRFSNAADGVAGRERFPGLVALSDEALAGFDPSLVLLVAHGDPAAIRRELLRKMEAGGAWRRLREADAVHVLDGALFSANPGLGMADAAEALLALAHEGSLPAVSGGAP